MDWVLRGGVSVDSKESEIFFDGKKDDNKICLALGKIRLLTTYFALWYYYNFYKVNF